MTNVENARAMPVVNATPMAISGTIQTIVAFGAKPNHTNSTVNPRVDSAVSNAAFSSASITKISRGQYTLFTMALLTKRAPARTGRAHRLSPRRSHPDSPAARLTVGPFIEHLSPPNRG